VSTEECAGAGNFQERKAFAENWSAHGALAMTRGLEALGREREQERTAGGGGRGKDNNL